MDKKYTAHIISHAHWDREWYFSLEDFRIRLVDTIDKLMDIIEQDDEYHAFMFDGHTALIEDYLMVKPQNADRLRRHIQNGHILIGPWYVLPDQMLISGESHVRNYLFGERICRYYGKNMNIGYAPDAFGHPAQIPQIYKKLGLKEMLFWRGMNGKVKKNEFVWKAPDGSEILGIHLAYGYGNCPNLPNDPKAFLDRIDFVVDHYDPRSHVGIIPIMNGRDHLEAQPHIPAMAQAADAMSENTHVRHSSLPEFVTDLKNHLDEIELETYEGELYTGDVVALLAGTLSSRMYLKQLNQEVENLYEKWLEPFASISHILNASAYPEDIIRHGWRFILHNQPHDSICGCSIDEVHQEMVTRYHSARQIGETMKNRAITEIMRANSIQSDEQTHFLTVFNPSAYPRTETVECAIDMNLRLCNALIYERMRREKYEDSGTDIPLPTSVWLEDGNGNRTETVLTGASIEKVMRFYNHKQPHEFYAHQARIRFAAQDVPAMGYKVYKVGLGYDDLPAKPENTGASVENAFFCLACEDGGLNVLDKKTGKLYKNCGALEDDGDAGDEYIFGEIAQDQPIFMDPHSVSAKVTNDDELKKTLVIQGIMRLPVSLSADRKTRSSSMVDCPVTIEATITPFAPRVDFKTTIQNNAGDHRLRAVFETEADTDTYWCESAFTVQAHDQKDKLDIPGKEKVVTSAQKSFTSVGSQGVGIAVANKGLPEVEVKKGALGNQLCLTLMRCVGTISEGNSGLDLLVPDAQCIGGYVVEYSFIPHDGDWLKSQVYRMAHDFEMPMNAIQMEAGRHPEQSAYSCLSIQPPELVLSAFKLAEYKENTFVLRFYNTSAQTIGGEIQLGFPCRKAFLCDLREEELEEIKLSDNCLKVSAAPWEIVTITLRR